MSNEEMKNDLAIAQALVIADATGPRVVARSDDFPAPLEDAVLAVCDQFGRRPPGVRCPAALFAGPLGKQHVAVVQVADQVAPAGVDPPLGFRFLILTSSLYKALGDPFAIADRFPPRWSAQGGLPLLEWPPEPLPRRSVEQVQDVLKSSGDDMALLLGGAQALIDGSRLLLVADSPADALLRRLWQLLPDRSRCELWPATFAFAPGPGWHVAVVPAVPGPPWPAGYLSAEQCRDYPEGHYELALQIAVEAGDQRELDRLFARRTSRETLRLALYLVGAAVVVAAVSKFLL
jgi:hypothetical protein